MINNIMKSLLLGMLAVASASCSKDIEPTITPTPGGDVSFGGSLEGNALSRTIYGERENGAFPIYWLKDDRMFIASPQCLFGRNAATYSVDPDKILSDKQNYADELIKTGPAGIQWGDTDADFYSIYPQRNGDYEVKPAAGYSKENPIFALNMPYSQTNIVGTPEGSDKQTMLTADMNACFMYAQTPNVKNGSIVNLRYTPLSTAIRFKLKGPNGNSPATVTNIILHGPESSDLSGEFTVEFDPSGLEKPTVTPVKRKTSSKGTVFAQYKTEDENESISFLELQPGEEIELNVFIIPQDVQLTDQWRLEVNLSTGTTLVKKLGAVSGTSADKTTLKYGMIHDLPSLPALVLGDFDPANWMRFIPRNVYLSEISIPGSWNSLNKHFQKLGTSGSAEKIAEEAIKAQYDKGCRAFHIDTRYRRNNMWQTRNFKLGIANSGGDADMLIGSGGKVMKEDACPLFSEALGYITGQVKEHEYMIVFCTFAQNSFEESGADWKKQVSDACKSNTAVFDASALNANSTIKDVLGKVIVIVNTEGDIPNIEGSKCLFVNAPLTLSEEMFSKMDYNQGELKHSPSSSTSVTLLNTQAQITAKNGAWVSDNRGYVPTLGQRKTNTNNILEWSRKNYRTDNNKHDHWFYMGIGGYYQTEQGSEQGHALLAAEFNKHIYDKVHAMSPNPKKEGQTAFYPIGIALMNFITEESRDGSTVDGPKTANEILQLNNKFRKQFDQNVEPWPDFDTDTSANIRTTSRLSSINANGWD